MKVCQIYICPMKKMSDFLSFPLFGFTLVIKPRNFQFECHWNTLIFVWKKKKRKKMWHPIWIYPIEKMSDFAPSQSVPFSCKIKKTTAKRKYNNFRNTNFKFFGNSFIFFNHGICYEIKICPGVFCLMRIFGITIEIVLN